MRPLPAHALLRWTARTFGDDVATRVFEPLVADWQRDVTAAGSRPGRLGRQLRGAAALLRCLCAVGVQAARPEPGDWPRLARSAVTGAVFMLLGNALLLAPFVGWWMDRGWTFAPLALDLVPTTMAFAWPFALVPAVIRLAAAATDGRAVWRGRLYAVGVAIATVTVMAGLHTWAVPAANRDFRQRLTPALPSTPRAINPPALRLAALGSMAATSPNETRRRIATTFIWPAALVCLGWRVGRHRRSAHAGALVLWWMLPFAIAVAFQPVSTPFNALHPMGVTETPEFVAAAVWIAIALALRPGGAASPVVAQ
ncbi:MAG: hypothetical protein JNL48_20445 [Acidobacteria bacterium]|nr:hypothetical protein [Acidobacteriota bacterium]